MYSIFSKIFKNTVKDEDLVAIISWVCTIVFYLLLVGNFARGLKDANTAARCKAKSIGELITGLPYAVGCNLYKERFNLDLNGQDKITVTENEILEMLKTAETKMKK